MSAPWDGESPITREQAIAYVMQRLNGEIYGEEIPIEALAFLVGAVERPGQWPGWVIEEGGS